MAPLPATWARRLQPARFGFGRSRNSTHQKEAMQTMNTVNQSWKRLLPLRNLQDCRFVVTASAILLLSFTLHAALPAPLVNMPFSEGSGTTTTNFGSLGGSAVFVQPDGSGFPLFTNLTPSGPYVPTGNVSSVDFGLIAAGQYGRAVDLTTTGGDGSG